MEEPALTSHRTAVAVAIAVATLLVVFPLYRQRSIPRWSLWKKAPHTGTTSSRFWSIPELVLVVVVQLPIHDQASVTVTCRFLRDLTTPLLWRSLEGPRSSNPLLGILPSGLLRTLLSLLRGAGIAEIDRGRLEEAVRDSTGWTRFDIYAPFVKVFDLNLYDDTTISASIIRILHFLRDSPIFPNLEVLRITIHSPLYPLQYLPLLLVPSLRTLCFTIEGAERIEPDTAIVASVIRAARFLHLEELQLSISDLRLVYSQDIYLAITEVIVAQPLLRRLSVLDLAGRFIRPWRAASRLQHATHLTFREADAFADPWHSTSLAAGFVCAVGFPALRSASLELVAAGLPKVLSSITSTHLRELDVLVQVPAGHVLAQEGDLTSTSPLDGRLDQIQRFANLVVLRMVFVGLSAEWSDITSLLACGQLETVVLRGSKLSRILGNQELEAMARSWTHLTELEIIDASRCLGRGQIGAATAPPRITLQGLSCLATHCLLLRELTISVDARRVRLETFQGIFAVAMKDIRLPFSVVDGDFNNCVGVANFIQATWPNQSIPPPPGLWRWLTARYQLSSFHTPFEPRRDEAWRHIWYIVYASLVWYGGLWRVCLWLFMGSW